MPTVDELISYAESSQPTAPDQPRDEVSDLIAAAETKTSKEPDKLSPKEAWANATPSERLGMLLSSPWKKYKKSVEQSFESPLPVIPQIKQESVGDSTALGIGAGVVNTASGVVSGLPSAATPSLVLNPLAQLYSAPYFASQAIDSVKASFASKNAMEATQNVLGAGLNALGAAGVGRTGAKGTIDLMQGAIKKPSLVAQIDSKSGIGNPYEANASANEIAKGEAKPAIQEDAVATGAADQTGEPAPALEATKDAPPVFAIPKELKGSKPRYKSSSLEFESDLDKALYILAQTAPSKADGAFLKAVVDATGMTEAEARSAGRTVKDHIKMLDKESPEQDVISVESIHSPEDFIKEPALDAVGSETKNLPDWAREEMIRRGIDPNRPLNDVDLANPSVQEALRLSGRDEKGNKIVKEKPKSDSIPKESVDSLIEAAESANPPPAVPEKPVSIPEASSGLIRNLANRVISDKDRPVETRKRVAQDPSIVYDKFELNELAGRIRDMDEGSLNELRSSGDHNERAASTIELANRADSVGNHDLAGKLFAEASTHFTSAAQLLNVARLVKSPRNYLRAVEAALEEATGSKDGRPSRVLTEPQKKKIIDLGSKEVESQKKLDAAAAKAERNFSKENEKAYRKAQLDAGLAKKELSEFTNSIIPHSYADILSKAVQGDLLTPLSIFANVFGNLFKEPVERASDTIASLMDSAYSRATGSERKLKLGNPVPSLKEVRAGLSGFALAAKEMLTGPSSESYRKAEVQRGFTPVRSLIRSFTGKDLPVKTDGSIALSDRARSFIEGIVGAPPEVMFRLLNIGDKPFRRAAEIREAIHQADLRGLKGRELEKFLSFPDKEAKTAIEASAREAVFMQENKGVNKLNQFLDKGVAELLRLDKIPAARDAIKVMGRMIVPFRQFPVNYVMTALNFASPELAIGKALYYAQAGERRKALTNAAEGVIGMSLHATADYLWSNGIISEPADKDAKRRSIQYEKMGPQQLNISGLNRLTEGKNPAFQLGDLTVDWGKMGIPAAVFYLRTQDQSIERNKSSKLGVDQKTLGKPDSSIMDTVASRLGAFPGMASFALDQSFMAGTSALLEAFKSPDPENAQFQMWAQNMFRVVSAIPVPNTVEALARAKYEFIPELKGDNLGETLGNIWNFKTMQLPHDAQAVLKRDMWGEPLARTPLSANPYTYQFVDVTRSGRDKPDPFRQKLIELFDKTSSPDVYPSLPNRNMDFMGITVKLTPKDAEKIQEITGRNRREMAEPLVMSESWDDMEPWARVYQLRRIYDAAASRAKQEFLSEPQTIQAYFPELIGKSGSLERVLKRDAKASLRVSSQ